MGSLPAKLLESCHALFFEELGLYCKQRNTECILGFVSKSILSRFHALACTPSQHLCVISSFPCGSLITMISLHDKMFAHV